MLTTLLNRIAPPQNSRDRRTISHVARSLEGLLLLSAGSFVVGACGLTVWNLKPGRVLVEVAAAAIVVGLVHAAVTVRRLRQEMASRAFFRSKRLALPPVLADGIEAAERKDAPKVAEAITARISKVGDFSDEAMAVFDCVMFDLLNSNPSLSRELRLIARGSQKKH